MANAHNILDVNWDDFFDFEAWARDNSAEGEEQIVSSASPGHPKVGQRRSPDELASGITGQIFTPVRGLDELIRPTYADGSRTPLPVAQHGMPSDMLGIWSPNRQAFPGTWTLPDQIPPFGSEEHIARNGMETPAFEHAPAQPDEVHEPQMPLEGLTLARAGLSLGTSALQSETYRLGTAGAIRRSGTVQLQNDYDDIAAVKQSAKNRVKRMLQVYDQPVRDRPPPDMAPELFLAVQHHFYQATVNLLRHRHQYHTENCMYLLLDAVPVANHHGPRFCRFGYTPDLTSICSERLQRCMDLMASDWTVRLRVLEQLELHSFVASPSEWAREVRRAAVTEMQAQEAMGRVGR
ncbi:hypothetical protein LTR95_008694 [Oleoguttula sp. CCFEE 5521]